MVTVGPSIIGKTLHQVRKEERARNLICGDSSLPRIAMISTHGYVARQPPLGAADTGGQVVYVLRLAEKLSQMGYEVDIWTRQFEHQPALESVSDRVRIIRIPCGGRQFIPKEYMCKVISEWIDGAYGIIRRYGLHYEYLNSHYWDAGLAGLELGDRLSIPHFFTPHSLGVWKRQQMEADFPEDKERFDSLYNFGERIRSERQICVASQSVIATTPCQIKVLADSYNIASAQCQLVPPGYDEHRFYAVSEAARQMIRKRIGFHQPTILALGRLARNKGYDLLIRGFAVVARRQPDVQLYLAVGGEKLSRDEQSLLDGLKQLVNDHGLQQRVRFGSYVPDAELADYYRAADVFVLSSRYEPFGMTAIEAMACGTPTVVTIHGGLHEALTFGRHALFADPFDAEDLGISILKVLRYPRLRSRLIQMGAHRARSLFTWTGIAQQMLLAAKGQSVSGVTASCTESSWDDPWADAGVE